MPPFPLRPGTLRCKQRQFGPSQMSPETPLRPFISTEKLTKKIRSKRPANFSSDPQKKHSAPRVQQSLVAHLRYLTSIRLTIAANAYNLFFFSPPQRSPFYLCIYKPHFDAPPLLALKTLRTDSFLPQYRSVSTQTLLMCCCRAVAEMLLLQLISY